MESDSDNSEAYDWPEGNSLAQKLAILEQDLICPICQSFFNNPQILICGHSYCSICIRKHLDKTINRISSDICPSCKEKAEVFDLKRNCSLASAVASFKRMRKSLHSNLVMAPTNSSLSDVNFKELKNMKSEPIVGTLITKRMPHYSFHGLKKDKVKKIIEQVTCDSKVKIRTDGDKDALERRLRELIHMNNAQVGSDKPMTFEKVIKYVNDNETKREKEISKSTRLAKKLEKIKNGEVIIIIVV